MKKMTDEELETILDLHAKWLRGESDGVRAELRDVDLSHNNLSSKDLREVCLENVILEESSLLKVNLSHAILKYVNLQAANLAYAKFDSATLFKVNLKYANIRHANFCGASFYDVSFRKIEYNENTAFFALQCPEEGSFIGYKKAKNVDGEFVIVKLQITEDAKRSSATSRKCRCSKAKVLSITSIEGEIEYDSTHACYDRSFVYKVGEIVEVTNFNEDRWSECDTGIHFFITRDEAVQYF